MEGSSVADSAVFSGHGYGDNASFGAVSDYSFLLPPLPTRVAVLNLVMLHGDLTAKLYRVSDFK